MFNILSSSFILAPANTLIKQKSFIILEPKEIEMSEAVDIEKAQKLEMVITISISIIIELLSFHKKFLKADMQTCFKCL
jgi:hypothetical protein